MVKDVDLAQDLTHDILIKAFLKLNTFQGRSSFSTWLYQVSYTHCIDYLRKSKRMKSEELDEEHFDSGDDDPNQDQIHEKELLELRISRLWEILEEIQPEEKMFLLMKYQDNTSIRDMAEQFEMSESAVKMRLKRIRDKVRALDTLLDQKEGAL
jgi:RNA polymerase sigma-70 factor (ECF subfamily)